MTKSKWHWSLIVVSLLLLLPLTAGCLTVTIPDEPAQTSGFLTYTDSTNGFSIAYPKDWQKMPQELLPEEAIVGFFRGINHPDPSSYNVMMGEWSSGMTVEDLYSALKSNYETTMEGYSFISKDNLTINGIPAIKHTCTLRTGGQTRKAIQVLLVNNNRAWFLTLGSPPEYFATHESTFNTIINSFRLSGATTSIPPVQPAATTSGFLTYTDQVNGFSFSYPQGWEETPRQGLSAYTLIGFRSTKLEAGFAPNVNVVSEKLTSSMSISDYWEQQERQFNSLAADTYTSPSIEYTDSNGLPAIKHIYTITTGGIQVKMIQLSVIQGNTAYTISCACATSVFSSYESTFNAIINSFRLLQPATTAPSTGLLTYTDSANGFSIAYPQDWQKMPQEMTGDAEVGFWQGTGQPDPSLYNVSMTEWPSGMTVEDFYGALKPEFEKYEGYSFISKDNLTINGIPAIEYTFSYTEKGKLMKLMLVLLVKDNSAWFITFGSTPEFFATHESTFNTIARSFQLFGSTTATTPSTYPITPSEPPAQPATPTPAATSTQWVVMQDYSDANIYNYKLNDIWGSSGTDVFVVGSVPSENKPLILRYNGHSWSRMTCPGEGRLEAVWGSGPNDVFAVGYELLILHYNGQSWIQMPRPDVTQNYTLYGVWGSSMNNVYAVGDQSIILHYNGSQWTVSKDYEGGPSKCTDIWGSGPNDIFACCGSICHYDGKNWSYMDAPTGLDSVQYIWGASSNDVYASVWQKYEDCGLIHYDGNKWTKTAFRAAWDIWGSGPDDIFLIEGYIPEKDLRGAVWHYDGYQWKPMTTPRISGISEGPDRLWGNGRNDVFGVDGSRIYHYDGR